MDTDLSQEEFLTGNYLKLKEILETGLAESGRASDLYHAKGHLIEVQGYFKGLVLRREDREELYNRLQSAFAEINTRIDLERSAFEAEARENYTALKPSVSEAAVRAVSSEDMKSTWEKLLQLQAQIKSAKLLREHRDELYAGLQEGFEMIRMRRDEVNRKFETEAKYHYSRLKALVDKGLRQAEETHEYKETREFLKKIQSEFRGIKLTHEQREELYSRLQTAFDILGKRLDDYFRNKKKNWAVKMQFTLSRFSADIYEIQASVDRDEEYLKELEDQLEIILSSGKEGDAATGVSARIATTRRSISQKRQQISDLEAEKAQLEERLNDPEN